MLDHHLPFGYAHAVLHLIQTNSTADVLNFDATPTGETVLIPAGVYAAFLGDPSTVDQIGAAEL